MSQRSFRLITLGRLALVTPAGEDAELARRRRKLAFLAVLAVSRRPLTRAQLAEMFWGDEDEERARHSLSDVLSHLRRVLGRDAIAARSEHVELQMGGRLAVDASEFESAVEMREWTRATSIYAGPLLDGFQLDRAESFEEWLERERARLARLFVQACEGGVPQLAREERWADCHALSRRWLQASPRSADAAQFMLRSAAALPDVAARRAGLAEYEAHAARVVQEFGARPDPRVHTLAQQLQERLVAESLNAAVLPVTVTSSHPERSEGSAVLPPSHPERSEGSAVLPPSHPERSEGSAVRRRRSWLIAAGLATAAALTAAAFAVPRHAAEAAGAPVIAVTSIESAGSDSASAWLGDGLREMLATDLSHASSVAVTAPATIRDLVARANWHGALDAQQQQDLARRAHATWSVSGTVSRTEEAYVLDVTVRDVARDAIVQRYEVSGSDVIAVADQAAAHVLGAVGEQGAGPHLSDVETASVEAFRRFTNGVRFETLGDGPDAVREFEAAIASDSAFVSALAARIRLAQAYHDPVAYARYKPLLDRAGSRVTEWDRLSEATFDALHGGEHARAEMLARQLVERFSHDPRAYEALADVYSSHGKLAESNAVLMRLVSLDSLAIGAGDGPCAPCEAFGHLGGNLEALGDFPAAERIARRWTEIQPSLPRAWASLGASLSFEGHFEAALAAVHRAQALDTTEWLVGVEARTDIMARRLDAADALMRRYDHEKGDAAEDAMDVHALVQRERGQLRASVESYATMTRRFGGALDIVAAHTLGRMGDTAAARKILRKPEIVPVPTMALGQLRADDARAFAWHHALLADAIANSADTLALHALADSIQRVGLTSYYGRDWRLHHHVLGLIAARAGRFANAVAEFQKARWAPAGWTRTNVELAQAELALHQPALAIGVLRDAYKGPMDAMGRYVPRSELDYWMAVAFDSAGKRDSSARYAGYVRTAWANADPLLKRKLVTLP